MAIQYNAAATISSPKNSNRDTFMKIIINKNFEKVARHYIKRPITYKAKVIVKKIYRKVRRFLFKTFEAIL